MMYRCKKVVSFCIHGCSQVPITPLRHHFFHSSSTTDLILHRINNFLSIRSPKTLQSLTSYHAYIITTGNHSTNVFISSKLISLYAYLHDPASSKRVFDSFHGYKGVFLWNSMIKAYFFNGMYAQCLDSYASMRVLTTFHPNQFTIPMIVSACTELGDLVYGLSVHGLVFKLGIFEESTAIGSSFVYMYSKCGCVENAQKVFDEMPLRDVVTWTALVIGCVHNGESEKGLRYLCKMYATCGDDERPNFRTLEGGFQACGDLENVYAGRCLHGFVTKSGLDRSIVIQSSIFSVYSKCGTLDEAYMSFHEVPVKDIKLWTSIIGVYGKWGCVAQCLHGFTEMLASGINPDPMVVSCVISGLSNSIAGKAFHGFIIRRNYNNNQIVHNALVSMYSKFKLINYAENVFNIVHILGDKEVWNGMVCGYGKLGLKKKCIELFSEMIHFGIDPNPYSLVSVISSCSATRDIKSIHCYAIKQLMMKEKENLSVSNSLIDKYGNFGELTIARKLFCTTTCKDIITWNTMISVYTHSKDYVNAFSLFDEMNIQGVKPSVATLISMLSTCAHTASFEKGEEIHQKFIDEKSLCSKSNVTLATALIDMYAKCGKLEKSEEIFNKIKEKDVISWNVMISGYAMHGDATSAIDTLKKMERCNVKPNEVTFLAVLSACNHAGLVNEGKYLFKNMEDYYCVKPKLKHYACMVDLLGRLGYLVEAEDLVLSMPIDLVPDGGLWGALLSACKTHDNPEMGIRVAKHAIKCDPKNDGYYVIISNLYDSLGMWEEAEKMRSFMKESGVEKEAGWSAV